VVRQLSGKGPDARLRTGPQSSPFAAASTTDGATPNLDAKIADTSGRLTVTTASPMTLCRQTGNQAGQHRALEIRSSPTESSHSDASH
jgi:hypothetical protein